MILVLYLTMQAAFHIIIGLFKFNEHEPINKALIQCWKILNKWWDEDIIEFNVN